jgi:hypothetical protein
VKVEEVEISFGGGGKKKKPKISDLNSSCKMFVFQRLLISSENGARFLLLDILR